MQPSLEERASLVLGLALGRTRLDEITARHDVLRSTVAIWAQELVLAAPERFDAEMLDLLRAHGLLCREVHPRQTGRIHEVQPLDLLQSLGLHKEAGHVLFFHPHGTAQVWFEGGQLIDARSGALEGTEAVFRIAGLEAGDFIVEVTGASRPRSIEASGSGLILEAARRVDESRRILGELPSRRAVLASALPAGPRDDLEEDDRRVLERFGRGATVGEVIEGSTRGELATLQAVRRLHERELLRPTGEQRQPEVPSMERRVHAIEGALARLAEEGPVSGSMPARTRSGPNDVVRISGSYDRLRRSSGGHPRVSPSPSPRPRVTPRMLAIGGAVAGGLVVLLVLGLAFGGDDEPRPDAVAVADGAAPAPPDPPPPPCSSSMVLLPAAEVIVGHEDEAHLAAPVHRVRIPALCVDRYEVTAEEYERCVESGACTSTRPEPPAGESGGEPPRRARRGPDPRCTEGTVELASHPINCITWAQAEAYCRHAGKRLPTEAQWERAARSVEGRMHPWGNQPPNADRLNACGRECTEGVPAYGEPDGHVATAPVGQYPQGATPEGLHDLAGNVREWTSDGFGRYRPGLLDDPTVPSEDGDRVVRGGAFTTTDRAELHPAHRISMPSESARVDLGLRCVSDPAGP